MESHELVGIEFEESVPFHEAQRHTVVARFYHRPRSSKELAVLERALMRALFEENVGACEALALLPDGEQGRLFVYGDDVDLIHRTIEPVFRKSSLVSDATAIYRRASDAGWKYQIRTLKRY